jgi:hypothetical protein
MGLSSIAHEEIGVEGRKRPSELPYRVPITHTHTMVRNPAFRNVEHFQKSILSKNKIL